MLKGLSVQNNLITATNVATIPELKGLWAETLGDPLICIAILDGPVDHSHPSVSAATLRRLLTNGTYRS